MMRAVAVAVLGLLAAGCQTRVTHYTMLSTRKLDVSRMDDLAEEPRRAEGKFTVMAVGKIPLSLRGAAYEVMGRSNSNWQIDQAVERALTRSPGAVAMADVVLYDTMVSVPFLWEYRSCTVKGRPVVPVPGGGPEVMGPASGQ